MIRQLDATVSGVARPVAPGPVLPRMRAALAQDAAWPVELGQDPGVLGRPELHALCRNLDQLEPPLKALDIEMTPDLRAELSGASQDPAVATDRTEERVTPA